MTITEKLIAEINEFFRATGEAELPLPSLLETLSESELLARTKREYHARLLKKCPRYGTLPLETIPDLFLQALLNREKELEAESGS